MTEQSKELRLAINEANRAIAEVATREGRGVSLDSMVSLRMQVLAKLSGVADRSSQADAALAQAREEIAAKDREIERMRSVANECKRVSRRNRNKAKKRHQAVVERDARIAELQNDLDDERGWNRRRKAVWDRIGVALEPIRKKRSTGEPSRNDADEVEAICARIAELEAARRDASVAHGQSLITIAALGAELSRTKETWDWTGITIQGEGMSRHFTDPHGQRWEPVAMHYDGEHPDHGPCGCDACLRERIAELEAVVEKLARTLSAARSDIVQTVRSNQCNLTGEDIITPEDRALPERIGRTAIHQRGIDESLAIVKRIDADLTAARAAQRKEGE
ncbi:MAG: hypothetical protein ACIAXF_14160 [Phycisphaerales bacterium JB063]